jgi:hypothetical protein
LFEPVVQEPIAKGEGVPEALHVAGTQTHGEGNGVVEMEEKETWSRAHGQEPSLELNLKTIQGIKPHYSGAIDGLHGLSF